MKQVSERLDSVAAERARFHLREMCVDRFREVAAASREKGSMLNECGRIYGMDEYREKIVKMLVEDVREKEEMSVLPIVGLGGLGKTTLAQLVFNDPIVVDHFDKRIWVCVSDNFDVKTLVKAMIESATGSGKAADLQHLDALERCLWKLLSQKRCLVVLDDVWNDQQQKWYELKDILSCGSTGSSTIVTTRQKKVADIMGTLPPHCLEGLSDEHCWMLLKQRAFGQQEEEVEYPELEVIGKQIVRKCAGVPLAAKALGGILRFKRTENEWMYVRDSEMWKLSPQDGLIMPALRLSYHHLPLELRQCFAYFATFPKDYQNLKEHLIHLWMAHGYISSKGTLQVEDVGNEICNELVLRSLLQPITDNIMSMHDLVHDLAESIMEDKVPRIQIEGNIITASSTIRQVNLFRNIVLFPKTFKQDMTIASIMELTSLRVLNASGTGIRDLPTSIRNLKHLRFLNLSFSQIRTLPNSLCSLWNLQTLNLHCCYYLEALPKNTRYLCNLQHLYLHHCWRLSEMPSKIREITQLKILEMFIVGVNKGNQLEELECLNLGGRLEIQHLERVKDHMEAKRANLADKKNLRDLSLSWYRSSLSKLGEDVHEKVLEALEPHPNLEQLSISGFGGTCIPLWMTNSTLGKIDKIEIMYCHNLRCLPKLGELPHLKKLLCDLGVEYIIDNEVGSGSHTMIQFPAVEELSLRYLPNLKGLSKEQDSKGAFLNLTKLWITHCPSLILPTLSSLKNLEDLECSSSTLTLFSQVNNLTRLRVWIEEKMACFPVETLAKLTNLCRLEIHGANEISVPEEGQEILGKLEYLTIDSCKRMICIPKGLLRHLTGLKKLYISSCPESVELLEEIKHLQNLESVHLEYLPKKACLPQGLQHLSSLRSLHLLGLPELDLLPDWLHLLTTLDIVDCPKVVSLPPAILHNLKKLIVRECPELERRCRRGSGEEWHKIAHIPCILIGE